MGKPAISGAKKSWSFTAIMLAYASFIVGKRSAKKVVRKVWDTIRGNPSSFIGRAAESDCWKKTADYLLAQTSQEIEKNHGKKDLDRIECEIKANELKETVPCKEGLSSSMLARATSLVGSQDGEDVTNEAWLSIHKYPVTFLNLAEGPDPLNEMTHYALGITRHAAYDFIGRNRRDLDVLNEFAKRMVDDFVSTPEVSDLWANEGFLELFILGLASITPRGRLVFRLRYAGVPLSDIPDLLGPAPADEPTLGTATHVANYLSKYIRPDLARAIRAQACLSSVARDVIHLYSFDGLAPEVIQQAPTLPPRNASATQLNDRKTHVGATVAFLARLRGFNREIFRRYYFKYQPVEFVAASLPRSSKGKSLTTGAVGRRLRRVLKDFVETVEPLS